MTIQTHALTPQHMKLPRLAGRHARSTSCFERAVPAPRRLPPRLPPCARARVALTARPPANRFERPPPGVAHRQAHPRRRARATWPFGSKLIPTVGLVLLAEFYCWRPWPGRHELWPQPFRSSATYGLCEMPPGPFAPAPPPPRHLRRHSRGPPALGTRGRPRARRGPPCLQHNNPPRHNELLKLKAVPGHFPHINYITTTCVRYLDGPA